jgi:outer membrane lipoprotein SlyB
MRTRSLSIAVAALAVLLAAGCAAPSSGKVYSREEARTAMTVFEGVVKEVKPITIEGQKTWMGGAGGGWVGYELGRSVGHGTGRDIAGAVGGVAGAVAGQAVEEAVTRQKGIQITVRLDNGETIAVAQSADVVFSPGERVDVLRGRNGSARVTKP